MTRILRHMGFAPFVVMLLVAAMAASGFAHRLGVAKPDPELAIFIQNGFSLADICGDPSDPDHSSSQVCEACRLVSAAVVPQASSDLLQIELSESQTSHSEYTSPLRSFFRDPSRGVRAPPIA